MSTNGNTMKVACSQCDTLNHLSHNALQARAFFFCTACGVKSTPPEDMAQPNGRVQHPPAYNHVHTSATNSPAHTPLVPSIHSTPSRPLSSQSAPYPLNRPVSYNGRGSGPGVYPAPQASAYAPPHIHAYPPSHVYPTVHSVPTHRQTSVPLHSSGNLYPTLDMHNFVSSESPQLTSHSYQDIAGHRRASVQSDRHRSEPRQYQAFYAPAPGQSSDSPRQLFVSSQRASQRSEGPPRPIRSKDQPMRSPRSQRRASMHSIDSQTYTDIGHHTPQRNRPTQQHQHQHQFAKSVGKQGSMRQVPQMMTYSQPLAAPAPTRSASHSDVRASGWQTVHVNPSGFTRQDKRNFSLEVFDECHRLICVFKLHTPYKNGFFSAHTKEMGENLTMVDPHGQVLRQATFCFKKWKYYVPGMGQMTRRGLSGQHRTFNFDNGRSYKLKRKTRMLSFKGATCEVSELGIPVARFAEPISATRTVLEVAPRVGVYDMLMVAMCYDRWGQYEHDNDGCSSGGDS